MKRNRVFRLLASLTVVVLCMTAFSVTAFAGGGDGDYYTGESAETTPEPTEEPATGGMEPEGQPLTPEGNATLVDDYYGDKQLITVTTKAGQLFFNILIDRANEDKGDRRSLLEPGGRSRPDGAAGGRTDGGKASCLYLHREMPGWCGKYRLSGLRGEYERVCRESAGGGAGA